MAERGRRLELGHESGRGPEEEEFPKESAGILTVRSSVEGERWDRGPRAEERGFNRDKMIT